MPAASRGFGPTSCASKGAVSNPPIFGGGLETAVPCVETHAGLGTGVGRALGVGVGLAVAVAVGVAVGVAVTVGVAVAVGVGVSVGEVVGVGVGVPPPEGDTRT